MNDCLVNVAASAWVMRDERKPQSCGRSFLKTCTCLLAFWLAAAPWLLRAEELPIIFARSGQNAVIPLRSDDGKTGRPVALWAFDRRWGEPAAVKSGAAEFVAPKVRVPIVFRMIPLNGVKPVLGELVVYPDHPVPWDKDTQLVAVGAPDWFDTWSEAVGLPVRKFKKIESLDIGNRRMLEKPVLLIIGGKAAGNSPAAIHRLAAEHTIKPGECVP